MVSEQLLAFLKIITRDEEYVRSCISQTDETVVEGDGCPGIIFTDGKRGTIIHREWAERHAIDLASLHRYLCRIEEMILTLIQELPPGRAAQVLAKFEEML